MITTPTDMDYVLPAEMENGETPAEAVTSAPVVSRSGVAAIAGRALLMLGALFVAADLAEAQQGRGGRGGRQSAAQQSQINSNQQRAALAEQDWKYTIEQINGQTYAVYTGMSVNELLLLKQSRDNLNPQAQQVVDKAIVVTSRDGKQHPAFQMSGQIPQAATAGSRILGLNAAAPLNMSKRREDETLADAKQGADAIRKATDLNDIKSLGIRCFQTISEELKEVERENPEDVRTIRLGFSQLVITTDIKEAEALYREINSLLAHTSNTRKPSKLRTSAIPVAADHIREIMTIAQ